MTLFIKDLAFAYVNHGRWIADCPRKGCNNAMKLKARQVIFECRGEAEDIGCGMVANVEWPSNPGDIWMALNERPIPATRNWFPAGHPLAERWGLPCGQTPQELIDEQKTMEEG